MPNYSGCPKQMIGEVELNYVVELESRLREIDENYKMYYYSGQIIIKKDDNIMLKTGSINKLKKYVEDIEERSQ